MLFFLETVRWAVWTDDEGQIWAQGPSGRKGLLQDADSLCGIGLLETGIDDIFRAACGFHDHAYLNRAEFERWGFDREWIDKRFLKYMLLAAGDDLRLRIRAWEYYLLVREWGWIFYYRHPGKNGEKFMAYQITKKGKHALEPSSDKPVFAAFNQGAAPVISCVNLAKTPLGFDFSAMIAALQEAVDKDFAPIWGTPATLQVVGSIVPGTWGMVFYDDSDVPNALGYHDLTPDGFPILKTFVHTDLKYHQSVSVTASHELWEALVDPGIQMLAMNLRDGKLYAYETADAVEETSFKVGNFQISNFVYPAWFESFRAAHSVKFDHLGLCSHPFQILRGGYMPIFDKGRWTQVFAHKDDELLFHASEHPRLGQRLMRTPDVHCDNKEAAPATPMLAPIGETGEEAWNTESVGGDNAADDKGEEDSKGDA